MDFRTGINIIFSRISSKREWTSELEETVRKVQMHMNEACERYFVEIKHKAVKVYSYT